MFGASRKRGSSACDPEIRRAIPLQASLDRARRQSDEIPESNQRPSGLLLRGCSLHERSCFFRGHEFPKLAELMQLTEYFYADRLVQAPNAKRGKAASVDELRY